MRLGRAVLAAPVFRYWFPHRRAPGFLFLSLDHDCLATGCLFAIYQKPLMAFAVSPLAGWIWLLAAVALRLLGTTRVLWPLRKCSSTFGHHLNLSVPSILWAIPFLRGCSTIR